MGCGYKGWSWKVLDRAERVLEGAGRMSMVLHYAGRMPHTLEPERDLIGARRASKGIGKASEGQERPRDFY